MSQNGAWRSYAYAMGGTENTSDAPIRGAAPNNPFANNDPVDEVDLDMDDVNIDEPRVPGGKKPKASHFRTTKAPQGGASKHPAAGSTSTAGAGSSVVHMTPDQMAARIYALEQENAQLRENVGSISKNFPRCYPIAHHDIQNEIPASRRFTVKCAFSAWSCAFIGYFWNWLLVTIMWITGNGKDPKDFVIASVMVLIGVPASWLLWYKMLYRSQKTDRLWPYSQFFLHGFVHIVWCWFTVVAPPIWVGDSCAGIWSGFMDADGAGGGLKIFLLVAVALNIALWGYSGLAMMTVYTWAMQLFRSSPEAQAEAARKTRTMRVFANMFGAEKPPPSGTSAV